jgi:hypothetical protein
MPDSTLPIARATYSILILLWLAFAAIFVLR